MIFYTQASAKPHDRERDGICSKRITFPQRMFLSALTAGALLSLLGTLCDLVDPQGQKSIFLSDTRGVNEMKWLPRAGLCPGGTSRAKLRVE